MYSTYLSIYIVSSLLKVEFSFHVYFSFLLYCFLNFEELFTIPSTHVCLSDLLQLLWYSLGIHAHSFVIHSYNQGWWLVQPWL